MKRCLDCGLTKDLGMFPPAVKRSDGRGSYCRDCMRDRSKASYRKRSLARGRVVREPEEFPEGHKRCGDCKELRPLIEFPANKNSRDGRHTYCKPCHAVRGNESVQRLYGSTRHYHLKRRYGIGAADVDQRLADQDGLCALCGEKPAEQVDHDHLFGQVRGILCFNCNGGLGQFRDRVDIMRKAIDYLERTTWQRTLASTGVYRLRSPRPEAAASPTSSELQRLISSRRG